MLANNSAPRHLRSSSLRDPGLGQSYRTLAGLRDDSIPCRATFTNFRGRLGVSRYEENLHALVSLVEKLGFISYKIQATDGTLFPSAARYRGCCHFNDSCASIAVDNVVQKVRDRVLYRIQEPAQIVPGGELGCKGAWVQGSLGAWVRSFL